MERIKPQEIDPSIAASGAAIAAVLIVVFLIVVVAFSFEVAS